MSRTRDFYPGLVALTFTGYGLARILEILPRSIPSTPIVALDVLSAMAFALVDGSRNYRWRGILVFAAIFVLIGNAIENIGVATGIPFGRYEFIELMGPKLLNVPVLLGLAYIGMAYVSWRLARIILGCATGPIDRLPVLALPLAASFIMVAWDLAQDPVWATFLRGWRWRDGGPWFGVPVSNFFGWYFTNSLIYLVFALYLRRWPGPPVETPQSSWWPPVAFYALCAAGNVLQILVRPRLEIVQDASGQWWRTADITRASALVSLFVMGAFVALATMKLVQQAAPATD